MLFLPLSVSSVAQLELKKCYGHILPECYSTTAHLASQCPFLAVTPEPGLGVTASSGINVDIMIKWRNSLHFFYSLYWQKNNVCFPNTIAHFYYQVSLLMVVQNYWHADNDLRLHLHFWNTFHLSSFCQELASVIQSFYFKIGLLFNLCYSLLLSCVCALHSLVSQIL